MAAGRLNPDMGQMLLDFIESGAKKIVNDAFDRAIEQATAELNEKRDDFLAKMATRIRSWSRIEDHGHQIVITIEKVGK